MSDAKKENCSKEKRRYSTLPLNRRYSTKGKQACAVCNKDTMSYRLKYGSKEYYMCHHRWLPLNHEWR